MDVRCTCAYVTMLKPAAAGSRAISAHHALRQRSCSLSTRQFVAGSPLSTCVLRESQRGLSQLRKHVPLSRIVSVPRGRHLNTCSALCVSDKVATATHSTVEEGTTTSAAASHEACPAVEAASDVDLTSFETSSLAKWASDAAATLTELPEQGDLASLGLCANTPVGWLQWMMEYIHVHAGLPWWGAIVASTFILRAVIFPLVMKVQKNGVIMNNINPEIQNLMKRQREFRQTGNENFANQYSHKIWSVYQKHKCNPLKAAVLPLVQVPLFLSFFIAIRRMAAVPVESMKTGGMLWFEDLTVPDPYYILPVLACGSFVASIEVINSLRNHNYQFCKMYDVYTKYLVYALHAHSTCYNVHECAHLIITCHCFISYLTVAHFQAFLHLLRTCVILCCFVFLVSECSYAYMYMQLGGETGVGNPQTAKLKNVFRLMPIILIPISASFPSVRCLHYTSQCTFTQMCMCLLILRCS